MIDPPPSLIPMDIDVVEIVAELNRLGWLDYKIEIACGLSAGHIAHLRSGNIKLISYQRAARLYNFWLGEVGKTPGGVNGASS